MYHYNILTSFNEKYFQEVAQQTVSYLDQYWISSGNVYLYHELNSIPSHLSSRVVWRDLYSHCPEIEEFGIKWKDHPSANGSKNFRTDAIKFVHKTFAIWHCAKNSNSDWLVWLDCDACFYKPIDQNFLDIVFNENYNISYLGRPKRYSECGFLAFNLKNKETIDFLNEWENLYVSGEFINLPETHDSWTFDFIRKSWKNQDMFNNLNSEAKTNKNPFSQSKIGSYVMHAKGKDKKYQLDRFKKRNSI